MAPPRARARSRPWDRADAVRLEVVAGLSGTVALTGIQGLAPALPVIQEALGLSTSLVGAVTIVYILPSVFSAYLGGLLAQRVGLRSVLSGALVIYGLAAAVILLMPTLPVLLGARVLQGAAAGAVFALSTSVLGDVLSGGRLVSAQSRRTMAMAGADALLPLVGGLLVGVAWLAAFAPQLLALPIAAYAWYVLRADEFGPTAPTVRDTPRPPRGSGRERRSLWAGLSLAGHEPGYFSVMAPGFLRFFLKFTLLTYFPILAVEKHGLSPAGVGWLLGLASVAGLAATAVVPQMLKKVPLPAIVGLALLAVGVGTAGLALAPTVPLVFAAMVLAGCGDGSLATLNNILVTVAAPPGKRSTFVGLAYSLRNVGKLTAPVLAAAAATAVPLVWVFVIVGALGIASAGTAWPIRARLRWLASKTGQSTAASDVEDPAKRSAGP